MAWRALPRRRRRATKTPSTKRRLPAPRNPIPSPASWREGIEYTSEKVEEAAKYSKEEAAKGDKGPGEVLDDSARKTGQVVGEVGNAAMEETEDVREDLREKLEEATEKGKDLLDDVMIPLL
mmetsp:Transcript_12715/g.33630  ORF Transcript_12715/g.33630 Transcript_12715/m.33630 type:complete len:122 (-) Transcript_12715:41-406(-)